MRLQELLLPAAVVAVVGAVGDPTAHPLEYEKYEKYEKLCANIDQRLPCDTNRLSTTSTEGSSFGEFIGGATAAQTKRFYNSPEGCPVFQNIWDISPSFRQFVSEYFDAHTSIFPTIQEEVIAMAKAMNMDPSEVFMQNACSELYLLFGDGVQVTESPQPVNDPPIYAPYLYDSEKALSKDQFPADYVPTRHNEDWWSGVADLMSIVDAGDWMGYLYPGQLPGTSFVVNSHGLSITMNSLYPSSPGFDFNSVSSNRGVAYVFAYVLRDIIRSSNTNEVINKLYQNPIYSGYSLNVMSACEMSVTNIEGYGDRVGVQSRNSKSHVDSVVGHFNAYINSAVEQDYQSTSVSRKSCLDYSTFRSTTDVRDFLGDLDCPVFFTDLNGNHGSETLSTWIADPATRQCTRYRLPKQCEAIEFESRCIQDANSYVNPSIYGWSYMC